MLKRRRGKKKKVSKNKKKTTKKMTNAHEMYTQVQLCPTWAHESDLTAGRV